MSQFTPSAFVCPRCSASAHASGGQPPHLYLGQAAGIAVHACGTCGGAFLDAASATKLAMHAPEGVLALASVASASAKYQPDLRHPLACPVCRTWMTRTHAKLAGVELDACKTHGTWYDRDELVRVAHAIRGAGWQAPGARVPGVAVAGAAAAGVATAAAMHGPSVGQSAVEAGANVAVEVGSEIVVEGVFALIGVLFD